MEYNNSKIAYVLERYPYGQPSIVNELITLKDYGCKVHIVALRESEKHEQTRVDQSFDFPVSYIGQYSSGLLKDQLGCFLRHRNHYFKNALISLQWKCVSFRRVPAFVNVLEEISPDIVYVNWAWGTWGSVMYACRILNIPFVFSVRGTDIFPPPKDFALRIRTAERIITPSQGYFDYLVNEFKVPEDKLRLVPNAIRWEKLKSVKPVRPVISGSIRLLCLSDLRKVKRIEDIIVACHLLKDKNIDAECHIYGEGSLKEDLVSQIKGYGLEQHVKLAGHKPQNELLPEFEWCDIFIHCSESESFCYAVVEAQAAGRPVVVADAIGGIRQSIQTGVTAILVPVHSPEAIAEAIISLRNNHEKRIVMGRAAQDFAWSNFSFDKYQKKFISALIG
jgi:glycosyltransferase involved in cell wall biosynthesis